MMKQKTAPFRLTLAALLLMALAPAPARAQQTDLSGAWLGTLQVGAVELRLVFHLTRQADGTYRGAMDSPDQGARGIPASAVEVKGDSVRVTLTSLNAVYRGQVQPGGQRIAGTFTQHGSNRPLDLARTDEVPGKGSRPQDPREPLPYHSEDVTYENPAAGVRLAGTFTRPREPGRYPTALLITGSGPQNRNEELMGHRPFLVLADHLTRRGIAVLRVDDRGVGESTGDFASATSADFASDVRAGIEYLKSRDDVDPASIGLIGHSEGGLIAPMVAAESDDVAWIVLMAGPGLPGDSILVLQSALIARASGVPEVAIAMNQEAQRTLFAVLREEPSDSLARQRAREALRELHARTQAALGQQPAQGAQAEAWEAAIEQQVRQIVTPWFRYFIDYDPRPTLRRVKVPVLAINGSLDLQVPSQANLAAIREALEQGGNRQVTIVEFPGLNHLFQTATTGAPSEYAQIEETIAPAVLERIADWVLEVSGGR
ncbi:MAG TPA: alpha/beta fold hydrolase [Longimicrobiales bacterium]